ncbi:MAG: hypothetical protein SGBAC_012514, partial [Bacillariaceae sp.]
MPSSLPPTKTVHDPERSFSWLNQASMTWDPSMIDSKSCYWNEEWVPILRATNEAVDDESNSDRSNHDQGNPSWDSKKTNSNYTSHENCSISYQNLFATAALMVVELRKALSERFEQAETSTSTRSGGMPVIVAIPEGPLLPLATLVVHVLNQPRNWAVGGTDASWFAIFVPLEPSEANKRNLHILKDISPSMILTVPGRDSDNLQLMVDSIPTITPDFIDISTLLKSIKQNMDLAQNVVCRTLVGLQDDIRLDANFPIGTVIADLASELSCELKGAQSSQKEGLLLASEPRVSHIVYTSGTTGIPKGDPCLSDCLATFQARATLALAPRSTLLSGLPSILKHLQVTHALCTPTLWSLMGMHRPNDFPKLQVVALGGEPIPTQLQKTWGRRQEPDSTESCRLLATYGVTEACVYQTCGEVFASSKKAVGQFVGQPLEGVGVRICLEDDQDKLIEVEAGHTGEIILYGSQLDRMSGYLNRADLIRKFQMDDGAQHYRTGDRGSFDEATNSLCISGRIVGEEGMVKVNGVRVELGEIENAIVDEIENVSHEAPVVLHCMAKAVSISTGADGNSSDRTEIRAYCVLGEQTRKELKIGKADAGEGLIVNGGPILTLLRSRCVENLKAACIPKAFVIILRLPLSPTGKRNRDALPILDSCRPLQSADDEPVLLKDYGKCGKKVAEVLTEYLNLQPSQESMVTTSATFAILGGDSLAATLVARALYAYHHKVENNRFLGGEYGKLTGAFDVVSLLRSQDLGAYVEMLDSKNLCQQEGYEEQQHNSGDRQELDGDSDASKPRDANELKQNALYDSLIQAITLGQSSIAMGLLSAGADPNHNLHSGRLSRVSHRLQQRALFRSSPMHIACLRGDYRVVKKLLDKGCKFNSPDASGLFPIHLASSGVRISDAEDDSSDKNRLLCVQYLIQAGAPMTMRDGNKQSILHGAARAGHCELLRFVMTTWKDKNGYTEVTPKHFFEWNDRWF